MIPALLALAAALLSGDGARPCANHPASPEPVVIHRDGGDILVEHDKRSPPECFNGVTIRSRNVSGTRELLRIDAEAFATARVFRSASQDFIFVSQAQPGPTSSWHFSRLLWVRPDGQLRDVGVQPASSCGGVELPALAEPMRYGGYSMEGDDHFVFDSTLNPHTREIASLAARLHLVRADTGYQLAVSSCKVTRPDFP